MNSLLAVKQLGQHVWLDNLSRTLLQEGELARLIEEDGIDGVTSNPAIFHKAVEQSPYYQDELANLKQSKLSAEQRYESLAIPDIRNACDLLACTYRETGGQAGYVSLEVSPHLAYEEEKTISEARRLRAAVDRENLLIKVPGTPEGVRAFEQLIAEGVNVNVTLMFSLRHQEAVAQAYMRGARRWLESGGAPHHLKSVASIFLSRVDTLVDKQLTSVGTPEALALCGKTAVAMAKVAYCHYQRLFHGPLFSALREAGIRPQFPLWASTGTKNPQYSDVLYVEPLIGPETVNTLPNATLAAFRDHGKAALTLEGGLGEAEHHLAVVKSLGIDLDEVGEQLQREGVQKFIDPYDAMLSLMEG